MNASASGPCIKAGSIVKQSPGRIDPGSLLSAEHISQSFQQRVLTIMQYMGELMESLADSMSGKLMIHTKILVVRKPPASRSH